MTAAIEAKLREHLSERAIWTIFNANLWVDIKEDEDGTFSVSGAGIEAVGQTLEDLEEYFAESWWEDWVWFDADSFGADIPKNWEAIARGLNDYVLDHREITPEDTDDVWETYWSDGLPGVPEPIIEE